MTRCGHKANKPSHSARWPLRQMKSDKSQMVTGLISGDCSSQDHDKALTSYSSEKIENHSVTISENVEVRKKRVNCQRKRDREPSRVPVKIILKALSNTKSRNRSLLKLPVGPRHNKELTGQGLVTLQTKLKDISYILIDEYSMLGQTLFGWIDRRCRQATGKNDEVFGGKSMILVGDPAQLPPVADKPLYHSRPSSSTGEQGYLAYHMFGNVVKLSVNQRVQGLNQQQAQFRDLLIRLRTGDSNEQDWKLLLARQPSIALNVNEFQDATRLYFSNEEVANYNFEQLSELHQPIACITARHSSDIAKKASSDDMSGLQPTIFLAKGAHVMLTMNLWIDVGLCNGATGTVEDFIYANNQQPPDLPVAVIVKFNEYRGPSISDSIPRCVPICPITITSQTLDGLHERQQLPLKLAWAITIHKSQGLTLPKAWIDIGQTETTAGISYVAISRVKTLSSCIIEPMSFERLKSLKKSTNLKYRLEEESRLYNLANIN